MRAVVIKQWEIAVIAGIPRNLKYAAQKLISEAPPPKLNHLEYRQDEIKITSPRSIPKHYNLEKVEKIQKRKLKRKLTP